MNTARIADLGHSRILDNLDGHVTDRNWKDASLARVEFPKIAGSQFEAMAEFLNWRRVLVFLSPNRLGPIKRFGGLTNFANP